MTVLSVVLPLYRTRDALDELVARSREALGDFGAVELVFVDDACPEGSGDAAAALDVEGLTFTVVRHGYNRGQHAAVITGLRAASGELIGVMDADLQDAPEDLATLVRELRRAGPEVDAIAAGRRGSYERPGRQRTARAFRVAMSLLTGGRIPSDAAMFLVLRRSARDRVLALDDDRIHLVAALGRAGARVRSVPVDRRPRPSGTSSYGGWRRLRTAVDALMVVTPLYPLVRSTRRRRLAR